MFSNKTFRVARHVALCAITALSFGAAAKAGDASSEAAPAQKVIRYADLDLSSDADVRKLYTRLQRGADQVCGQYKDMRNLRIKRMYETCYQESLARAVDRVGHAAVTAAHAADGRTHLASRTLKAQARS